MCIPDYEFFLLATHSAYHLYLAFLLLELSYMQNHWRLTQQGLPIFLAPIPLASASPPCPATRNKVKDHFSSLNSHLHTADQHIHTHNTLIKEGAKWASVKHHLSLASTYINTHLNNTSRANTGCVATTQPNFHKMTHIPQTNSGFLYVTITHTDTHRHTQTHTHTCTRQ